MGRRAIEWLLITVLVGLPSASPAGWSAAHEAAVQQRIEKALASLPEADRPLAVKSALELVRDWSNAGTGTSETIVKCLERVKRKGRVEQVDRVGVVLLVDSSGSMVDAPRSGGKRKIQAAQDAAQKTLEKLAAFQRAHPDKRLRVGVFRFDSAVHSLIAFQDMGPGFPALPKLQAAGGTAIGEALIAAKHALDQASMKATHIVLITDGENSDGVGPLPVVQALNLLPKDEFPVLHFVAFDISARKFADLQRLFLKQIHEAGDHAQLELILDSLLSEQILAEQVY
ncbi:MAG: VWA domain-containing protein [Deltaproteobacteria bacterium]|nr:VWA domain-containing protein [Deltaproteobacteria bacterium]